MEGFEPPIQFPVYAISSRAHSTSSATSPKVLVIIHKMFLFSRANYLWYLTFGAVGVELFRYENFQ